MKKKQKDNGGLAFPYEVRDGDGYPIHDHTGMTLRDYFAAKAVVAMITEPQWKVTEKHLIGGKLKKIKTQTDPIYTRCSDANQDELARYAQAAYQLADAMIAERAKP